MSVDCYFQGTQGASLAGRHARSSLTTTLQWSPLARILAVNLRTCGRGEQTSLLNTGVSFALQVGLQMADHAIRELPVERDSHGKQGIQSARRTAVMSLHKACPVQ